MTLTKAKIIAHAIIWGGTLIATGITLALNGAPVLIVFYVTSAAVISVMVQIVKGKGDGSPEKPHDAR